MVLYSYMAAQADEHNWLFTYSLLAPHPSFSPLLCEAEAGTAKGYHLLPCQLASWKVLQHKALEREWKVRERRDFQFLSASHQLQCQILCTLPTPATPYLLGCAALRATPTWPSKCPPLCCFTSRTAPHLRSSPPCQAPSPELLGSPYSTSSLLLFCS